MFNIIAFKNMVKYKPSKASSLTKLNYSDLVSVVWVFGERARGRNLLRCRLPLVRATLAGHLLEFLRVGRHEGFQSLICQRTSRNTEEGGESKNRDTRADTRRPDSGAAWAGEHTFNPPTGFGKKSEPGFAALARPGFGHLDYLSQTLVCYLPNQGL